MANIPVRARGGRPLSLDATTSYRAKGEEGPRPSTGPPGVPTNLRVLSATALGHNNDSTGIVNQWRIVVAWDAPSDIGGSDILHYDLEVQQDRINVTSGSVTTPFTYPSLDGSTSGPELTHQLTFANVASSINADLPFLWRNTPTSELVKWDYYVRVRAENDHGPGGWSAWMRIYLDGTSYRDKIAFKNQNPDGSTGPIVEPMAPGQVTPAPTVTVGSTSLQVDWTIPTSGGEVTGYNIRRTERNIGTQTWVGAKNVGTTASRTDTDFIDSTVVRTKEYQYQVQATGPNGEGGWSDWSDEARLGQTQLSILSIGYRTSGNSIILTWTVSGTPSGYQVQYRERAVGASSWSTWRNVSPIHSGTGRTYTHTNRASALEHQYQVRALSSSGNSSYRQSAIIRLSTGPVGPTQTVPDKVTGVTGTPGDKTVTLEWNEASGTVTSYQYRNRFTLLGETTTSSWTTVVIPDGSPRRVNVPNLNNHVPYEWQVRARNSAASDGTDSSDLTAGPASDWVSIVPVPNTLPAPRNLSAAAGDGRVTITWDAPSDPHSRTLASWDLDYEYDSDPSNGISWQSAADVKINGGLLRRYVHSSVTNGYAYRYRLRAVTSGGTVGEWTTWTSNVAPIAESNPPDTPSSIGAVAGNTSATVSWTPAGTGGVASDYNVQYALLSRNPSWSSSKRVGSSLNRITISGLVNGRSYMFRVQAVNDHGSSEWKTTAYTSPTVPFGPPNKPLAPSNLLSTISSNSLRMYYRAIPPNSNGKKITGYKWIIEYQKVGSQPNAPWARQAEETSRIVTLVYTATRYPSGRNHYRVSVAAVNAAGTGPYSDYTTVTLG